MELITAGEARELTESGPEAETQKEKIATAIAQACRQGKSRVVLGASFLPTVKAELRSLGYKVTTWDDPREGACTQVEW